MTDYGPTKGAKGEKGGLGDATHVSIRKNFIYLRKKISGQMAKSLIVPEINIPEATRAPGRVLCFFSFFLLLRLMYY